MIACMKCSFVPLSGQRVRTNSLLRSGRCDSRRATCEASTASKTTNALIHHSCDMYSPCCVSRGLVVYRACARDRRANRLVPAGLYAIARDREDGCDHEQPG